MKLNGYYTSNRGVCKVTYYGETTSIIFFDKLVDERFLRGEEPQDLKPLSIDQAVATHLNETEEYLRSIRFNPLIKAINKEPKILFLLLQTYEIDHNIIRFCSSPYYENFSLKSVFKPFDCPGMVHLRFSISFNFETEDEESKTICGDCYSLLVPQTLFENFDEEVYSVWLEQALDKKQKEINERFDNQISELQKAKKLLVIK